MENEFKLNGRQKSCTHTQWKGEETIARIDVKLDNQKYLKKKKKEF
jgi:hypothetical protein